MTDMPQDGWGPGADGDRSASPPPPPPGSYNPHPPPGAGPGFPPPGQGGYPPPPPPGYGGYPPAPPGYGYGYQPTGYGYPYQQPQKTNGLAVASLILGILWIGGLGSLLALIFGPIGKGQIQRSGGAQTGRGIAIAGVVLGALGLIGLILIIVVAAVAAHNQTCDVYGNCY